MENFVPLGRSRFEAPEFLLLPSSLSETRKRLTGSTRTFQLKVAAEIIV